MANNKDKRYKRLFMIYVHVTLGESNARTFDEIASRGPTKLPREFPKFTHDENNEFLAKWKRENGIKSGDWLVLGDREYKYEEYDQKGVPILVKRRFPLERKA